MMQRWLLLPYRLSILACLTAAALAALHAGYAAGTMPQASISTPLPEVCAILLVALAVLLWRQHRLFQRPLVGPVDPHDPAAWPDVWLCSAMGSRRRRADAPGQRAAQGA